MTEITRLDDATISKIAAGEVVERPASVVKELVENSLDAGATRIDVTVEAGGTDRIQVADDGRGMTEDGLNRAIEQHTTSKIETIDDLETGVGTLGFRGEALHTIGAVSRMTVETRPQDGGDVGTEVRVEGGEVTDLAPVGRAPGTTVTVTDLFFNTPARRKYLKREATEFGHVNRVVSRYALANPEVAISLTHDGSEVFATAGTGDLQGAVLSVYGRTVAESMIEVAADPTGPVESVSGLVSDPETTRSGAEYVSTFVNGRYVRAASLRSAIVEAYGKQLAADRYPFAVLFLEVPAETVDVNVHPRKMAVRFDDGERVREAVTEEIRSTLLDHGLLRSGAPRGRSAPSETPVTPSANAGGSSGLADPGDSESDPQTDGSTDSGSPDTGGPSPADASSQHDSLPADEGSAPEQDPTADEKPDAAGHTEPPARHSLPDRPSIDVEPLQTDLDGQSDRETTADIETERLPPLRILGQLDDTYVVAESPDGLLLLDQHAADERVNYERLQDELGAGTDTQRLVEPVELPVTPQEASQFAATEDLTDWGFEAAIEDGRLVVTGVPAVFDATLSPELLRDVLAGALDPGGADDLESAADALLADMACYPSITGNTSLTEGTVLDLVRALDSCENPYACPHGRPTVIEFSIAELEDRFERDYPGHAHRRD